VKYSLGFFFWNFGRVYYSSSGFKQASSSVADM
jgi:hypothetical protein